ncbi:septation protein A [Propionivibrio sp.]|uniref:septation protein A n=1 Tax=Propionivibrio sp. TaxID=2212460 RepID=UPI002612948F|nr:septation protein A [Propionivibrio sp.]
MKFLFDLFPVILFFAAFKFGGIYVATGVAIAATFSQVSWVWLKHRKVDAMLWVSLAIITVFGGMTLVFHDENFIKWKPTVLYWAFALALAGSSLVLKKNLILALLGEQLELPDPIWQKLNWSCVGFFVFMGIINLAVAFAFGFSTDVWVNFKLFGGIGLMFVFVIIQGLLLAKYIQEKK